MWNVVSPRWYQNISPSLYCTPTNRGVVHPVTWRDQPITAVIQLLFKLRGRIRDLGRNRNISLIMTSDMILVPLIFYDWEGVEREHPFIFLSNTDKRYVVPVLADCRASVADSGPTINQHWDDLNNFPHLPEGGSISVFNGFWSHEEITFDQKWQHVSDLDSFIRPRCFWLMFHITMRAIWETSIWRLDEQVPFFWIIIRRVFLKRFKKRSTRPGTRARFHQLN